jgi:hypothetical protein
MDSLKQALFKAYLRYVRIEYKNSEPIKGYVSFTGPPDWTPLIMERFFAGHGSLLPLEDITKITWGKQVFYSAPG